LKHSKFDNVTRYGYGQNNYAFVIEKNALFEMQIIKLKRDKKLVLRWNMLLLKGARWWVVDSVAGTALTKGARGHVPRYG